MHPPHETLLMSLRPQFAERVLDGTKSVELRRTRPIARVGQDILIYASSPTMALVGSAIVQRVDTAGSDVIWSRVQDAAAISKADYDGYFAGAKTASAIWLTGASSFDPIPLRRLREQWPWFRPPQSYCFVRATFDGRRRVTSLAPRRQDGPFAFEG
jgi:predicted transcriptional regulator